MKVGFIAEPNKKGQIVIPKQIRDALRITADVSLNIILRGEGMYIYPIKRIVTKEEEPDLLKVLEKTQGAWANSDWKEFDKREKIRRRLELKAAKKAKNAW